MPLKVTKKIVVASWVFSLALGLVIIVFAYIKFFPAYMFHTLFSLALVVICIPPAIVYTLDMKRKREIDEALPRLLDDIAESQEAGMTLLQALEEVSHRRYGPLTEELRKMVVQMSWGIPFERAVQSFINRVGTDLTAKAMVLIVEAIRLGGDTRKVFRSTSNFVKKMLELRKERESQLRPFFMTTYVTVVIFAVIMLILYYSFFLPAAKPTGETHFLKIPLSIEGYKTLIFDLSIIEAFFGGLLAGKMSEGTVTAGLKHSVIVLLVMFAIFSSLFR